MLFYMLVELNLSGGSPLYILCIDALTPLGGSDVCLTHFYNIEIGNLGCGAEDNHNLKLSLISFFYYSLVSIIFSKSFKKSSDK